MNEEVSNSNGSSPTLPTSRPLRPLFYLLALCLGLVIIIALFAVIMRGDKLSSDEPKVAASIFPLYDLVRNVAGERVEVVLLLPPGANPHTFEPKPSDIRMVTGTDAVFYIGHALDDWSLGMSSAAGVSKTVRTDAYVELLMGTAHSHEHETITQEQEDQEDADHHDEEIVDPHYWLSVSNAISMVGQIEEELSLLYPEYSSEFQNNAAAYIGKLETLDEYVHTQLSGQSSTQIATFHNAWSYLAHEYGLEIVVTFEEFSGEEPTPAYLTEFQNEIREHGVTVIFAEPQSSVAPLEPIAQDLGVTISQLDDIGGVSGRESYVDLIRYNVTQIVGSLK
jgi:zinc transport system substrate-binding protein